MTLNLTPKRPQIAVSFAGAYDPSDDPEGLYAAIDVVELRLDLMASSTPLPEVIRSHTHPVLGTIRSKEEGGKWDGTDAEKLALYQELCASASAVDCELRSPIIAPLKAICEVSETTMILSSHNFEKTPPLSELCALTKSAVSEGADVVKIATMVHSEADIQTLTDLLLSFKKTAMIVIGMGRLGGLTRLFFPSLGSCLSFASYGTPSAPGQLPLSEMLVYRDKFYGDPIEP